MKVQETDGVYDASAGPSWGSCTLGIPGGALLGIALSTHARTGSGIPQLPERLPLGRPGEISSPFSLQYYFRTANMWGVYLSFLTTCKFSEVKSDDGESCYPNKADSIASLASCL